MAVDLHENVTAMEPPPTTTDGGGDAAEAVVVYKKGAWSKEEDDKLKRAVDKYGLRNWVAIEKFSGLSRPAKNCRLRWLNYLRPNLKKYPFTQEEEELIFHLHAKYGNSWSRIASKLPGRSDNEIKNFWHKRAKKRHKHHLPIYPTTKQNNQNYSNLPNTIINHNNYSDTEIHPSTPNIPKTAISTPGWTDASIHYPQTAISTPQPYFLPSPSSSHIQQSPTNHLTDQTTPISQTQNLLISPHTRTQSIQSLVLMPNTAPHTQTPTGQNNPGSNTFTPLRQPPILSSPQGPLRRFSRTTSKLLPQDSNSQMQFSPAMESPRSPLKLNLSPRIPSTCSPQTITQTNDSQMTSLPAFQLQSPNTAPLSPLKLRLSIPIPQESCFQSNLSIHDSNVQLGSSCSPNLTTIQMDSPVIITNEPPSIQINPQESDSSLEIMEELKEAQARVRLLKKKLKLRKIINKRTSLKGSSSENTTTKDCLSQTNSRTKNFLDDILRVNAPPKNSGKKEKIPRRIGDTIMLASEENRSYKVESENAIWDENLVTKPMSEEKDETFNTKNLMTFDEQSQSIDLFDHFNIQNNVLAPNSDSLDIRTCPFQGPAGKCTNEGSTIEGLFSENSNLLHDNLLPANFFDQKSEIEDQFSSQRQVPLIDAFCPVYSQSSSSPFQFDQTNYFVNNNLGREVSNIQDRKYMQNGFMDGNMTEKSMLCESNSLPNQYLMDDLLDSSYFVSTPIMELEYFRAEQFCLGENSKLCEPNLLMDQSPADNLIESRYTVENLWPEGQVVSQDHTFSTDRFHSGVDLMESRIWNDESCCGHTGVLKQDQEHDHMNNMSEELSSLLEFFPTNLHTLEWYNIANAIPDREASGEFDKGRDLQMSSTSQPLTTADYI